MNDLFKKVSMLLLGGSLFFGSASAQTLKIATLAPEGSGWMTAMKSAGKEIEARSEGRVKIKLYGGGVQGSDQNVLRKIRVGQLHGMTTTGGGLGALYRDAALYSLPMMFNNTGEADHVRSKMDTELRQGLEDAGWVNFGFTYSGFAHVMSDEPITSLADLQKRRIWVPQDDRVGFEAIRTLGGAPVQMPMTDVLTGLETDLLDTVVTSAMGAVVFQWHGQVRYVTGLPLVYLYGALVISRQAFSRISVEDQVVVREVMERMHRELDRQGAGDEAEFMAALADSGIEIRTVDPSQVASWRERVQASNRRLGREGEFSIDTLDRLQAHLDEYRRGFEGVAASGNTGGSR